MLKSHFNLVRNERDETALEEEIQDSKEYANAEGVQEEEAAKGQFGKSNFVERKLTKSDISTRLCHLGKTANGDGYTYIKVVLTGLGLTDITKIKIFKYLQFVDVSQNNLDLQSLQVVTELPFLVLIQADYNYLDSPTLKVAKYLQVMIFNNNNITSVHDLYQPELCTLEVGFNKISKILFENRMPTIKCLDFRHNLIEDISDINSFPVLDSLYLAGNKIKSLIGIWKLPNLRVLHLRNNPIKSLEGFSPDMKKLQYINLRNCKVSTLRQVKKLKVLLGLETLVMRGCPYMGGTGEESQEASREEEDAETRIEMLATLPWLKKINKEDITPEERADAKELLAQWIEEGEKDDEEEEEEQEENADEQTRED